uniref:GNAT family N-acetyltransferase n=1 Tax=Anaerococcus mediterraneensis TaxID=1870984 RepID=UPI0009318744|nr:GNAT family N-acetyltransferase [Anaerococcus mediterraneensis]
MAIEIKTGIIPDKKELLDLYNDASWTAYTEDIDLLEKAIKNSLKVWTLWDREKLIGLARIVGDGHTITYLQDILILKAYQGQGLGSRLLSQIVEENKNIRQFVLLTDNSEMTKNFYKKLGLVPVGEFDCLAFMK